MYFTGLARLVGWVTPEDDNKGPDGGPENATGSNASGSTSHHHHHHHSNKAHNHSPPDGDHTTEEKHYHKHVDGGAFSGLESEDAEGPFGLNENSATTDGGAMSPPGGHMYGGPDSTATSHSPKHHFNDGGNFRPGPRDTP